MGVMTEEGKTGNSASGQFDNVTCPFCGIHCDDLTISAAGGGFKVQNTACPKAVAGFERKLSDATPRVAGKAASLEAAIAAAAGMVKSANLPLFSGLGTDVEGIRAALSAADRAGGIVDHAMSDALLRNYKVMQTSGWLTTTFTEARNRADLFVIVGSNIPKSYPRFFERVVCAERSMFTDKPEKRTIVFLGEGLDKTGLTGSRIGDIIELPAKAERLGEILTAMRALHKGVKVTGDTIGGLPRADVESLVERCKTATYGVMVWAPSSFTFPNADLTVHAACEYIKDINQTTRFAGLYVGGSEGSASAGAVSGWQTGYPLRVSFASGKPVHDIERFATNSLLASKEADVLVWIATLTPGLTPPASDVPTIALATPGMTFAKEPAVVIPVGTPGIDHEGSVVRCDSSVSLPLRNLGRSDLPRVADVLAAIEAAL